VPGSVPWLAIITVAFVMTASLGFAAPGSIADGHAIKTSD
jgi:hypothetical protein